MRVKELELVFKHLLNHGIETFTVVGNPTKAIFSGSNEKEEVKVILFQEDQPQLKITLTELI